MRALISIRALLTALLLVPLTALHAADASKPNILLILADDLGYSDLGCYDGEIPTPNIDALANSGLRFTHMANSARCCPTRAARLKRRVLDWNDTMPMDAVAPAFTPDASGDNPPARRVGPASDEP